MRRALGARAAAGSLRGGAAVAEGLGGGPGGAAGDGDVSCDTHTINSNDPAEPPATRATARTRGDSRVSVVLGVPD